MSNSNIVDLTDKCSEEQPSKRFRRSSEEVSDDDSASTASSVPVSEYYMSPDQVELDRLYTENERLSRRVEKRDRTIRGLLRQIAAFEEDKEDTAAACDKLEILFRNYETDKQALQAKVAELQESSNGWETEGLKLIDDIAYMSQQVRDVTRDKNIFKARNDALAAENAQLRAKLDAIQQLFAQP